MPTSRGSQEPPADLIPLDEVLTLTDLSESGWRWLRAGGRAPRGWVVGRRLWWSRADIDLFMAERVTPEPEHAAKP